MSRPTVLVFSDFDHTLAKSERDYSDETILKIPPVTQAVNTVIDAMEMFTVDVLNIVTGRPASQAPLIKQWLETVFADQGYEFRVMGRPDDMDLKQTRLFKRKTIRKMIESPAYNVLDAVYFENDLTSILEVKLVFSAHNLDYRIFKVDIHADPRRVVTLEFERDTRVRAYPPMVHVNVPPIERGMHDLNTVPSGYYRTDDHYRG